MVPLLLVVPVPLPPTAASTGDTVAIPRYSAMRTSGYGTEALKVTVMVLLGAATMLAA